MSKLYFKGETVILYVKFLNNDKTEVNDVKNVKVRILHEHEGNIYEDLPWTKMNKIKKSEYISKFVIPYNADNGIYNIFYTGELNGILTQKNEQFHVGDKSNIYKDAIKIYGYIDSSFDNLPLSDVTIRIKSCDGYYYTETSSMFNGYWESFLYPNNYNIEFNVDGFETLNTGFEIGFDSKEINFGNTTLNSYKKKLCGNGIAEISDSYILKNGIPLDGLLVTAISIDNIEKIIAQCVTDNNGTWKLFLDPGYYILNVNGNSMNMDFNKIFRLKIDDDCEFELEDISENKITPEQEYLSNGDGSIDYIDTVMDKNGQPIADVQVNIYKNNKVFAECYTDTNGKFIFHLDPGEYSVEVYHPNFKDLPKFNIKIS